MPPLVTQPVHIVCATSIPLIYAASIASAMANAGSERRGAAATAALLPFATPARVRHVGVNLPPPFVAIMPSTPHYPYGLYAADLFRMFSQLS